MNATRFPIFSLLLAVFCCLMVGCRRSDPDAPIVLRFWHPWTGSEGAALQALIHEYNAANPHVIVRPSNVKIGDKLLASIAGGIPPDIATVWSFMLVPMGEGGCFLPLEDWLAAEGIGPEQFLPGVYEYGLYSRHRWGIPASLNARAIYYDRDLVASVGLNPDSPPRTIAELDMWAAALTARRPDGSIERLGFAPRDINTPIWLWSFGGSIFDFQARRFRLVTEPNVRAVTWMASHYQEIGIDAYRRFESAFGHLEGAQNPFLTGNIALREDGQWFIRTIEAHRPTMNYSIFPYPPEDSRDTPITSIDGSFWVIPNGTRYPEESWHFLAWLTHPDQSARFCAALANIPPLQASLEHPAFVEAATDPTFQQFIRFVLDDNGRTLPALPVSQQFYDQMQQTIHTVFGGRLTPTDFLLQLEHRMNRELERTSILMGLDHGG